MCEPHQPNSYLSFRECKNQETESLIINARRNLYTRVDLQVKKLFVFVLGLLYYWFLYNIFSRLLCLEIPIHRSFHTNTLRYATNTPYASWMPSYISSWRYSIYLTLSHSRRKAISSSLYRNLFLGNAFETGLKV